jgi:hypothetical protein
MEKTTGQAAEEQDKDREQSEAIDQAFRQMETIYKSRCVQPPSGSNVTVREISRDE